MTEPARILCVDDEENVLSALKRLFLDEDYEIIGVTSGDEGLRFLESDTPVNVVISDFRMPGMNGVEFLREVRSRWPETIRLVLSGYVDTSAVVAAINEGEIFRFVPKPWNDGKLKATVAVAVELSFLGKKRSASAENGELRDVDGETPPSRLSQEKRRVEHAGAILDVLPVGVISVDAAGVVVQCNHEAANVFGITLGSIIGAESREVLPGSVQALLEKRSGKEVIAGRIRLHDRDFRVRRILMTDRPEQYSVLLLEREAKDERDGTGE